MHSVSTPRIFIFNFLKKLLVSSNKLLVKIPVAYFILYFYNNSITRKLFFRDEGGCALVKHGFFNKQFFYKTENIYIKNLQCTYNSCWMLIN